MLCVLLVILNKGLNESEVEDDDELQALVNPTPIHRRHPPGDFLTPAADDSAGHSSKRRRLHEQNNSYHSLPPPSRSTSPPPSARHPPSRPTSSRPTPAPRPSQHSSRHGPRNRLPNSSDSYDDSDRRIGEHDAAPYLLGDVGYIHGPRCCRKDYFDETLVEKELAKSLKDGFDKEWACLLCPPPHGGKDKISITVDGQKRGGNLGSYKVHYSSQHGIELTKDFNSFIGAMSYQGFKKLCDPLTVYTRDTGALRDL